MHSWRIHSALGALLLILISAPFAASAQTEQQILIDFYESTNGDAWYRNGGWTGEEDHCSWEGIECAAGLVSAIRLPRNNITGPLNESFFELETLHELILSDNDLSGSVPAAAINDLPQFDNTSSENEILIDISSNSLSGELPVFLRDGGPGDRVHINLADNDLTGPVPASWVHMTLGSLNLSDNAIDASLTDTWQSLPTASNIALAGTGLHGSFPEDPQRTESDSELTDILQRLDLSRNQLQGELPDWFAQLSLQSLRLSDNELSGEMSVVADALAQQGPVILDLADNQFSGPIPEALKEVPLRRLSSIDSGEPPPPGLDLCWNDFEQPDQDMLEFINDHHHGGAYRDCQQMRSTITPVFSGSRYDPARSGEGFVQHVLENGQVLQFWFTYPIGNAGESVRGQQAWFISVASPLESSLWIEQPLQPFGRFGSGSHGFEKPTFRLSVDSLDSTSQQISYSREYVALRSLGGIPLNGLMSKRHEQTVLTRLAGTTCDTQQPHQWVAGAWYSPARSGEGFMIDVSASGSVVVYWFTYEPNDFERQAWMIGTGEFNEGQVVIDEMIQPAGTLFGTEFNSSEIEHIDWGSLTLEFDSETSGHIWFDSNLDEYGSGNYPIERLARPKLADCD